MNIVVISFDSLRYDAFGFSGNPQIFTPNIDRLAFDCWNYENYYSSSKDSMTNRYDIFHCTTAKCNNDIQKKSLFEILGKDYHKHLIYDNPKLATSYNDFTEYFDSWMSVRGCYGDKFWTYDDNEIPENWEYSDNFDIEINPTNIHLFDVDKELLYYAHSNRLREKEEDWATARLFLLAGQFLKDNANSDNLFLWIDGAGMTDLWEAPQDIVKLYQPINSNGKIDPRIFLLQNKLIKSSSQQLIEMLIAGYYSRITFIDRWIGILLKTITSIGINDNTTILVTSSSGHKFPIEILGSINELENTSHLPLIVKMPNSIHQKDITPISSSGIYNLISTIAENSTINPSCAYKDQNSTIVCAASIKNINDFAVTDGIEFSHLSNIDLSAKNKISETALKFIKNRK
jgi:hypothetical protein